MNTARNLVVLATLLCATCAWGGEGPPCVGDCNGDDVVTVSDMVLGVNIVLGTQQPSACPAFQNAQGQVTVAQLIQGVNNLLNGCGGGTTTVRTFAIDCGQLTAGPDTSKSGIFTSGLSGVNAALTFPEGPLVLELGMPDANGIASFALKEDITLGIPLVDGSRFCLRFDAASSEGTIDCDGGTPYDITATRPANAPGFAFTFETGLGDPAPAGNGDLVITAFFTVLPSSDSTPCEDAEYTDPPQDFAFTTANGTATVQDTILTLTVPGEAFSCANFGTPGSGGMLAAPLPAGFAVSPIGDVVNSLRFGELMPGSCTEGLSSIRSWDRSEVGGIQATWGDGGTTLYVDGPEVGTNLSPGELDFGSTPMFLGADWNNGNYNPAGSTLYSL